MLEAHLNEMNRTQLKSKVALRTHVNNIYFVDNRIYSKMCNVCSHNTKYSRDFGVLMQILLTLKL